MKGEPVGRDERIAVLDILRGFAILGILLVNMEFFSSPIYPLGHDVAQPEATADRIVGALISVLAEGKFYTLFSFLFGLGFALQMARARSRGSRFALLYCRRLTILLLIGVTHAFFVWAGDVLVVYALIGFGLLLFTNRPDKTLIASAILCLLLPVVIQVALVALLYLGPSAEWIRGWLAATAAHYEELAQRSLFAYSRGTFADIVGQRVEDIRFNYLDPNIGWFAWSPQIFGMFLLGLYVGRSGLVDNIAAYHRPLRQAMQWGFGVGLPANLGFVIAREWSDAVLPSVPNLVDTVCFVIGSTALCLAYTSALGLLAQRPGWEKRLAPLAAVGRMALSNYLLQSVICTTLFYSYGLGWYGKVGAAATSIVAVTIFIAQIAWSAWWSRRFQFGPVEWLWRSLTYGKFQPMRAAYRRV